MERERVAGQSLCYSCSAVLQMSGCFTGRHGREVLQTIHGRLREIWRMMRRLCVVAQWWKCELIGNSECCMLLLLFTWPPGLFWHFVSLLPVEHKTMSWECLSAGANYQIALLMHDCILAYISAMWQIEVEPGPRSSVFDNSHICVFVLGIGLQRLDDVSDDVDDKNTLT